MVKDARAKAAKAGVEYFFTWNVNECVLWLTQPPAGADARSHYQAWNVVGVTRPEQLGSLDSVRLQHDWLSHLQRRDQRIAALAAERTSDADFQHEIVGAAIEFAIQRD